VFTKDETVFTKDETVFTKDETVFTKDEKGFTKDETVFTKDEKGFPRHGERVAPAPLDFLFMTHLPPLDRIEGCLLGGALGDALGYPIEFVGSADEIARRFGTAPPARLAYGEGARGLVSDDTQMTLYTAEGLVAARRAGASVATDHLLAAYQRWYGTQAMRRGEPARPPKDAGWLSADPRMHERRAPGTTCLSALALSFTRGSLATVNDPPNGSKGCGAVMRSAPFGFIARAREDAFEAARDAGVLTHGHPSG
jgi:ADP-ribosylglycohydrolase